MGTALRRHLERGGFRLLRLAPGEEPGPDALVCLLAAGVDRTTWLHMDPPEAVPESLGAVLSEALRCSVTGIAHQGSLVVYETARAGHVEHMLAVDGDRVLKARESPFSDGIAQGQSLSAQLTDAGFEAAFHSLQTIRGGRVSRLAFQLVTRADADVVEIDPGLSCPICAEAMQKRSGRWGDFFGCVRFPECRGKLTAAQAEAQRAS